MIKKWIVLGLLMFILGCDRPSVLYRTGSISLLFINKLSEEVLVKSKNGEVAFIGVFLLPDQQYLWQLKDSIEMYKDTFNIQTTFSFFTAGDSRKFDKYIGEYTFNAQINKAECEHADTCYIK